MSAAREAASEDIPMVKDATEQTKWGSQFKVPALYVLSLVGLLITEMITGFAANAGKDIYEKFTDSPVKVAVDGYVIQAGAPVKSAIVTITRFNSGVADQRPTYSALTNDQGHFLFTDVNEGSYKIEVALTHTRTIDGCLEQEAPKQETPSGVSKPILQGPEVGEISCTIFEVGEAIYQDNIYISGSTDFLSLDDLVIG